jgi:hypothetical protein
MDLDKIRSGKPKPRFIISLEWISILTLSALILMLIASLLNMPTAEMVTLVSFMLLIEIGLLSIFYGVEGLRYKLIWITLPNFSGPTRIGFNGTGAILVSTVYILMGLALMLLAIVSASLSSG